MSIYLKILSPNQPLFTTTAQRVVLPVREGMLTIIERRAPRSEMLMPGDIVLLDEYNAPVQKIKISGGIAEIAQDICQIATESFEGPVQS